MRASAPLVLAIAFAAPAAAQDSARYVYYAERVYAQIGAHYSKPPAASTDNCILRLNVAGDGALLAVETPDCSSTQVQKAALAAIAAALPLAAPPEGIRSVEIDVGEMHGCADGGPGCAAP